MSVEGPSKGRIFLLFYENIGNNGRIVKEKFDDNKCAFRSRK